MAKNEASKDITTEIFENMAVPKAFFTLTIPNVCGKLAMLVYNIADTWFISQTGITELVAGVSLGMPILLIMTALGDIFGQGGASVITRLLGKKENDAAKRASSFCFWTALLSGAVLSVFLLVFRSPILRLVGADDSTYIYASQYYRVLVLGAPFMAITTVPLNILRTEGLARQSMTGNLIGSILNLILDPVFIFVFGWGAAGAAAATVTSYIASASYYIWVYQHQSRLLSIRPSDVHASGSEIKEVFSIGIPGCLTNLTQSIALAITNHFLLPYGSDKIAALGIAYKVAMVSMMTIVAFSFGSMSLVGYNYGAENKIRLRRILQFLYTFELSLAVVMVGVLFILSPFLIRLFLQDPAVISSGTEILRCMLISQIFAAFLLATTCVFQATGQAKGALMISINRQGILFVIIIAVMSAVFGYRGVIWAQPVCDFICSIMAGIILWHVLRKIFTDHSKIEQ